MLRKTFASLVLQAGVDTTRSGTGWATPRWRSPSGTPTWRLAGEGRSMRSERENMRNLIAGVALVAVIAALVVAVRLSRWSVIPSAGSDRVSVEWVLLDRWTGKAWTKKPHYHEWEPIAFKEEGE